MSDIEADAVIIGSGPAGVSAAWPLVEAGFSVVMLDSAERPTPGPPGADILAFRRSGDGWRHAYGDDLSGIAIGSQRSPKFATRIAQSVLTSDARPFAIRANNFVPVRSFSAGGLSKIWGAVASAYDDLDLYKYPIRRSDLESSYQAVAARIGLSGDDDDLTDFHGRALSVQPPLGLRLLRNC